MRKTRLGHKCWYRLCNERVPHAQQFCSAACQQAAKHEAAPAPEPTYAPIRVHTGRTAYHRVHGIDRRD